MIYKTLKKVSDVCQLLDKSKYPSTQTVNGITFTNNGDGSYTANGTLSSYLSYLVVAQVSNLIVGHKYYSPNSSHISGVYVETKALTNNANFIYITDNIHEWVENETVMYITLVTDVGQNSSVENVILKPQLFDLTEMYGAGHEPTTVEQFRQDFPEELYDYKPYCFVKSYKNCLTCTTKNLFDIPLTQGYPSDTNYYLSTKRTFTIGTYIVGMTRNNYYTPSYIANVNISKNSISFKTAESGYGISVPFLLTVGNTYMVSCKADNNFYPGIGISYYKEDGTLISFTDSEIITNNPVKSFTVPENTYYTLILFYGRTGTEYTFSNIQLEEGSTATEYQPYGYIQSRKKSLKISNSILL